MAQLGPIEIYAIDSDHFLVSFDYKDIYTVYRDQFLRGATIKNI